MKHLRMPKAFEGTDDVNDASEVDKTREQLRMFKGF